ncbi:MAG: DegV family protein, partial [Lawsonibacter sp.]|nr:DegV family protein [Lawsonibacter sp.]
EKFYTAFKKEIDAGNSVVCITVSSGISGTYQSACVAKDMLGSGTQIDVLDSKACGITLGIAAIKAARLAKQGLSHEVIAAETKTRLGKMHTLVLLDRLDFLAMGGRINDIVAKAAGLLNIKPVISFNAKGEIVVVHKAIGFKKGMQWLKDQAVRYGKDFSNSILGFAYGENTIKAEELLAAIRGVINVGEVIIARIGCVIGTYTGVSGVGLFFEEA